MHAGAKLMPIRALSALWRENRGEAFVLIVTAVPIVAVSMFEGVLIGLALSIAKTAWETSHIKLGSRPIQAHLSGNATFLRLPKMLDGLEALPQDRPVELDLSRIHHLDYACRSALESWKERHARTATPQPRPPHKPTRVTSSPASNTNGPAHSKQRPSSIPSLKG